MREIRCPHYTVDLTEEFESEIVTPFIKNMQVARP